MILTEQEIDFSQDKKRDINLQAGTQIINAIKKSPLQVNRIEGKTVVNLIPPFTSREWKFYTASNGGSISRSTEKTLYNGQSIKFNNEGGNFYVYYDIDNLDPNKHYVIIGNIFIESFSNGTIRLALTDYGTFSNMVDINAVITQEYIGNWQTVAIKFTGKDKTRIMFGNGIETNGVFYCDGLRLFEISEEEFNSLDFSNTTNMRLAGEKYPYIEGVQHTAGVYIKNETNDTYQYFARDSKGDVLRLADGEYIENGRKWKEWEHVELTKDLNWEFNNSGAGFKVVVVPRYLESSKLGLLYRECVKYDGTVLGKIYSTAGFIKGDLIHVGTTFISISISNQDSGWGDNYTPTPEEIKAYFMGWVMYGLNEQPYVSGEKRWAKRFCGIGSVYTLPNGTQVVDSSVVSVIPTSQNDMGYKPYQLHYKLAEPYWEEIQTEGQVILEEGENHVTLGSGMVVREVTKPSISNNVVTINWKHSIYNSSLRFPTLSILNVYKNSLEDGIMEIWKPTTFEAFGMVRIDTTLDKYNPTAQYTVTYLALPHVITAGVKDVQATVYENIKSTLDKNVEDIAKLVKETDVNSQAIMGLLGSGSEIVEQGENANGYYIRWANGWQMCFKYDTTETPSEVWKKEFQSGRGYRLVNTWTFPAQFISNINILPILDIQWGHGSTLPIQHKVSTVGKRTITTTNVMFAITLIDGMDADFSDGILGWNMLAIGRWK